MRRLSRPPRIDSVAETQAGSLVRDLYSLRYELEVGEETAALGVGTLLRRSKRIRRGQTVGADDGIAVGVRIAVQVRVKLSRHMIGIGQGSDDLSTKSTSGPRLRQRHLLVFRVSY
jgi:hypothetical protein